MVNFHGHGIESLVRFYATGLERRKREQLRINTAPSDKNGKLVALLYDMVQDRWGPNRWRSAKPKSLKEVVSPDTDSYSSTSILRIYWMQQYITIHQVFVLTSGLHVTYYQ